MEEDRLIEEYTEEINDIQIEEVFADVIHETTDINIQNDNIENDVEKIEVVDITVEETTGSQAFKIVADHAKDQPDQHTIGAIEGLEKRLKDIEEIKTVYSNSTNQANYYAWDDIVEPPYRASGYFVTIHAESNKIRICQSLQDEFGVTVSSAGFIGGQDKVISKTNDNNYALVVHAGVVGVRCESDVVVGDYVSSDNYGIAQKTDGTYGYLVTALSKIDGVKHAIITLNTPTTQMQKFSEIAQDVEDRMDNAEVNIATAISVANAAYNKAQAVQNWTEGNVEDIVGKVDGFQNNIDKVQQDVNNNKDNLSAAQKQIIQSFSKAEEVRREANDKNNTTNSHLHSLIKALTPDSTWVDPEGTKWDDYFANYVNQEGFPTTATIKAMDSDVKKTISTVNQTAAGLETIVTSIDKYSVGEWSQSYGLSMIEARNILKRGMVYIPTENHREPYEYTVINSWSEDDKDGNVVYNIKNTRIYYYYEIKLDENGNAVYDDDESIVYEWVSIKLANIYDNIQEFTRGYYYTWNGYYWVESDHPYVYFSRAYMAPSYECMYWYRDTFEELSENGIIYKPYGLYKYEPNVGWVEVNVLDGNVTNRTISAIRQTANEISADITNATGSLAHLGARIDAVDTSVDVIASVVTKVDDITITKTCESADQLENLPKDKYYAVGTKAPYDIYKGTVKQISMYYDGINVMKPNIASIITAANEDESLITLNADKVNINGTATFASIFNPGTTTINGDCISSGTIKSNDGTVSIDLGNNKVDISGKITATSGYIGDGTYGFSIDYRPKSYIYWHNDDSNLLPTGTYYFVLYSTYYKFTLSAILGYKEFIRLDVDNNVAIVNDDDKLKYTFEKLTVKRDSSSNVVNQDEIDSFLDGAIKLEYSERVNKGYVLRSKQHSLYGMYNGAEGVYISTNGIGCGNGRFVVESNGGVEISDVLLERTEFVDEDGNEIPELSPVLSIAMKPNTKGIAFGRQSVIDHNYYSTMIIRNGSIDVFGNINMNGWSVKGQSDSRLKTNIINPNVNALDLLNQIELKSFDWISSGKHVDVGMIAQQLEEVIPDLVTTDDRTDLKSISFIELIPYLVKAIQELYAMHDLGSEVSLMSLRPSWEDDMSEDEKQKYVKLSQPPMLKSDKKERI